MYYTIHEYDALADQSFEHGVYPTFQDGMRMKWDIMDSVIPVSDEKARSLLIAEIAESSQIEYDELYDYNSDNHEELLCDIFDRNVHEYIENKRSCYELLLDYDYDKDCPFISDRMCDMYGTDGDCDKCPVKCEIEKEE